MTDRTHLSDDDRLGAEADALYAALIEAHSGLSTEQSAALNARMILLLMNEVGDASVIRAALARATKAGSD